MTHRPLRQRLRGSMQTAFTKIGEHVSQTQIQKLNSCINYLEVGRWLKANGYYARPRYADRESFYTGIAQQIRGDRILYMEFGVWQGASMRRWCDLLRNPLASLHGFDSFEGLPEAWDACRPTGTFSVNHVLPEFSDPRVKLHKGWFSETLPGFTLPEHDRLVLNLDADLYSSTIFVLRTLNEKLRIGTILMFDEFCDRLHEMKAFSEFVEDSQMGFRFLGATSNLEQVAFERCA